MIFETFLETTQTGDVVATVGNIFVRVVTGESYGHVGMVLRVDNDIWIAEQTESVGWRIVPVRTWIKNKEQFTFGHAPEGIRGSDKVLHAATFYNQTHSVLYGWLVLPLVWVSQITGKSFSRVRDVCSTAVSRMWKAERSIFKYNPDPGSIVRATEPRYTVKL